MRPTNPSRRHLLGAFLAGLFGFGKARAAQPTPVPTGKAFQYHPSNGTVTSSASLPPGLSLGPTDGCAWGVVQVRAVGNNGDPK